VLLLTTDVIVQCRPVTAHLGGSIDIVAQAKEENGTLDTTFE
jgi:hypothetical protein